MPFHAETTVEGAMHIITLKGRLDSATAGGFEKSLLPLLQEGGGTLLMDFSGLEFISSAGLRVILIAAKRMRQSHGKLLLCCLQDHVRDVFEISGFLKILDVIGSREAGLSKRT